MAQDVIVETRKLTKIYRDFWGRQKKTALRALNIEIRKGEIFGLLGPNGSGKTTTIKLLLGLLFPTDGEAFLFGQPAADVRKNERIGYLPEESYLYRFLNAEETLDFYGRLFNLDPNVRATRAQELIEKVGLKTDRKRVLREYSKGMRQRIGLAQALINDPDLVILDEPTSGLDPLGARWMKNLIVELRNQGKTVIMCSHRLEDVQDVCDRIAILSEGELQAYGEVKTLLQDTNRIEMRASNVQLTDEIRREIEEVLQRHGGKLDAIGHPTTTLEDYFLRIVEESKAHPGRRFLPGKDGGAPGRPPRTRSPTVDEFFRGAGDRPVPRLPQPNQRAAFPMFGALIVERDPYRWSDLAGGLLIWFRDVGSFAAVGVLLWLLLGLSRMKARDRAAVPRWESRVFVIALIAALVFYSLAGAASLFTVGTMRESLTRTGMILHTIFMAAGGACAVLAAALPFLRNLGSMRWRRVYALAKLSFKEAIRRRVLYAFSLFLIVVLFASWFIPSKSEDQVRTYVAVFFQAMSVLLLFVAVLMSSFSIPTDIKQQTIHTIVTKPVERFEVVLGRFLGFLALMTMVLLAVTSLSLFMVLRGVNPDAAAESLKAREPLYGDLRFENAESERKATNVGREWEYRSYITKPQTGKPQTACWDFATVSSSLGSRKEVRAEYTFDVYRTTKGQEGQPVACTFKFYTWRFQPGNDAAFLKERGPLGAANPEKDDALAEKYGYYEINSLPVVDYHTQSFQMPSGLFRNATAADPDLESEFKRYGRPKPPELTVKVTCDSATQYVGMAKYDLYIRLDDAQGSETTLFAINFFKGAVGLWFQLALIIGLAVVMSTYLSGVITFLVAVALYIGGTTKEFIEKVALGKNEGGGPMEAMVRITRRELSGPSMRESQSAGDRIVTFSDDVFRWVIRQVLHVIPDVDRYSMTTYVAEGFNISWEQILMSSLLLVGYLLPWAVLAYYLMKWREVASSN